MNILEFLVHSKVAKSKTDAKRLVAQGAVELNGKVVAPPPNTKEFKEWKRRQKHD